MANAGESSKSDDRQQSSAQPSSASSMKLSETVGSLSVSLSDRIELLASALRARWKSGQRIVAEGLAEGFYSKAWKSVAKNEEHLLDLLYHEILIRQEFDEVAECQHFVARFPHLRERIERLFSVHCAIEDEDWDDLAINTEDSAHSSDDSSSPNDGNSDNGTSAVRTPSNATLQWPRRSRSKFIVEPPPGYVLLDELGRGGMAVVYRAKQQILNRVVALKMLHGGGLASPEVLARIRQEARAVAQLQHPGIVQIHEVGEHNGLPYLSLEYVPGGTLHDWLKGQPLPPMDACRIVEQLALTTQFAHEQGIVHRDLKPANILLTERPDSAAIARTEHIEPSRTSISQTKSLLVKISDFGLARTLGHQSDLTATGQVIGTPSYMAPEQAAGNVDDASPSQDVYSLGAILFELLTGRPPFRGATLFDTLEQVRTDEPVPPRRLQPRVSVDLETVCLKCLQKSPERRYATAQQLADDLRSIQRGEPIQARPASVLERLRKLVLRHPTVSGLSLLTLVAIVAGIAGVIRESARATRERDRALELSIAYIHERDEARDQRQSAEQQKTLAEAARTEAVIAREQAEQSLDQALTAINSLSKFGMELRQAPQQQKTSRRILEETLKLYDQLEQSHGSSTRLRRQLAFTLVRAGEIQSMLRETTKAHNALQRGMALLTAELKGNPDDLELWRDLSYSTWVLGNLLKDTRRFPEAVEAYNQSLSAIDHELRLVPTDVNRLRGKANILTNICAVTTAQRKFSNAIPIFEQAIAILRELVQKNASDVASQSELGLVLHDYSETLNALNRSDEAELMFQESFSIRDALFKRNSQDHGTRNLFARLYMSRGNRLLRSKQFVEACSQFSNAAELLKPTVDAFPTIFEYQSSMLSAISSQLNCSIASDDAAASEVLWSELTDRLLQCRSTFGEERQVVTLMQIWIPDRIEFLVEQGRTSEALQIHDALIRSSEWLISDLAAEIEPLPTDSQRAAWKNTLAWQLAIAPGVEFRNPQRAIDVIREALIVDADNSNYLHTLATALYYDGQYSEALNAIERAIRGLPSDLAVERRDPMFPAVLAMIHARLGNIDQARHEIESLPILQQRLSKDGAHRRRVFAEAKQVVESQQAGSVK